VNLVSDLDGAVERGEILAYFQPQIDVASGDVVAVEALSRWTHPEYGIISPAVFIPLAEAHDLIIEIGDFMLDEACRCAQDWCERGMDLEVAVNVSAAQLTTSAFLDRLQFNLSESGLNPDRITIEITESLPLMDVPEVTARLTELRDLGLGVSLDDFGTGFSTLGQLLNLPATELKIDQSLIQDAESSGRLMLAVVEMSHDRGLRVVAEGVETERQLAAVRELECDRAQGYLFGRPVPLAEIETLLAS
jgi:EAL domain-containing protein (putative c-di-GMP-specific phosphodiesterase class I)